MYEAKFTDVIRVRIDDALRSVIRQAAIDARTSQSCVMRALMRAAIRLYDDHRDVILGCLRREMKKYKRYREGIGQHMREAKIERNKEHRE